MKKKSLFNVTELKDAVSKDTTAGPDDISTWKKLMILPGDME